MAQNQLIRYQKRLDQKIFWNPVDPDINNIVENPFEDDPTVTQLTASIPQKKRKAVRDVALGQINRVDAVDSQYKGDGYFMFEFDACTNSQQQSTLLTFSPAGIAFAGNWYVMIDGDISSPLTEVSTVADIKDAINALLLKKKDHSSIGGVVLNAGTIATNDAVYKITWAKAGVRPNIYGMSFTTDAATGDSNSHLTSTLNVAGVGYVKNLGLNVIKRMKIEIENSTIHEFDFVPVMVYLFNQMDESQQKLLFKAFGGGKDKAIATAPTVCVPMISFWSRLLNPRKWINPLPVEMLNGKKITYSIELNKASDLTDGAGNDAVLRQTTLIEQSYIVDENVRVLNQNIIYYGIDFNTKVKQRVSSGVTTDISLNGFKGSLKRIHFRATTVNDYDVNHDFFNNSLINSYKLFFDGSEYQRAEDVSETYMDSYVIGDYLDPEFSVSNNTSGSFFGSSIAINFATNPIAINAYTGGAQVANVKEITLQVRHVINEDCYFDVCAPYLAKYVIFAESSNIERFR